MIRFAYGLLLLSGLSTTTVFANTGMGKCGDQAAQAILTKGNARSEQSALNKITMFDSNSRYEGYHVYISVITSRGHSFDQVCEIIMKKSNCSYDQTFGCASTVDDLTDNFDY